MHLEEHSPDLALATINRVCALFVNSPRIPTLSDLQDQYNQAMQRVLLHQYNHQLRSRERPILAKSYDPVTRRYRLVEVLGLDTENLWVYRDVSWTLTEFAEFCASQMSDTLPLWPEG